MAAVRHGVRAIESGPKRSKKIQSDTARATEAARPRSIGGSKDCLAKNQRLRWDAVQPRRHQRSRSRRCQCGDACRSTRPIGPKQAGGVAHNQGRAAHHQWPPTPSASGRNPKRFVRRVFWIVEGVPERGRCAEPAPGEAPERGAAIAGLTTSQQPPRNLSDTPERRGLPPKALLPYGGSRGESRLPRK